MLDDLEIIGFRYLKNKHCFDDSVFLNSTEKIASLIVETDVL